MWASWVFWMIAAVALAFLEIIVPSFIFLGFAIGAALMGLLYLLAEALMPVGLPMAALVYAVLSLLSWIALRQLLGVRKGQVKLWDKDIND